MKYRTGADAMFTYLPKNSSQFKEEASELRFSAGIMWQYDDSINLHLGIREYAEKSNNAANQQAIFVFAVTITHAINDLTP